MSKRTPIKWGGVNGNRWDKKILLLDYTIQDSKIEKQKVVVAIPDSNGELQSQEKSQPQKALAIRFKKILKTFVTTGEDGREIETYLCEKVKDADGNPTDKDAEFYSWTGSKIMIDQANSDFGVEDLPCPTTIVQETAKNGKSYTKFT